jgi:7,8-dihydropterin-6-yl-methyl-4-(beta-D-ribofuranosyl)aminobenzene 5'-phosphate synthase
MKRNVALLLAGTLAAALTAASETALAAKSEITILYDAFGNDAAMKKDWGFSALGSPLPAMTVIHSYAPPAGR